MKIRELHRWNLSYSQAADLQKRLARRVQFTPLRNRPGLFAGIDCAFSKNGKKIVACVVVMKPSDTTISAGCTQVHFEIIETASAVRDVVFPYIPGLLSFREAPAAIAAVKKLKSEPDVFIIDGQGIAHPRRLGIAAHLGLFFDRPTIGCAKSRLIGRFEEPPLKKGSYSLLTDKNEIIGAVVRTRSGVKPVFVSVGNKCLLEDAVRITLDCAVKYRLPEPARTAHQLVTRLKSKI